MRSHLWAERGAEQLAETLVFGLLDQHRRDVRVPVGCEELVDRFRAITGVDVLGPDLPYCIDDI